MAAHQAAHAPASTPTPSWADLTFEEMPWLKSKLVSLPGATSPSQRSTGRSVSKAEAVVVLGAVVLVVRINVALALSAVRSR